MYFVYFKSKKELKYDRFVHPTILYSDIPIHLISFFLFDLNVNYLIINIIEKKTHKNTEMVKFSFN